MKKIFIRLWPIIIIFLVWFVFSAPFFILGKVPFPSAYLVDFFGPWSTYLGDTISYAKNSATPDVIGQIFPWKTLVIEAWKSGNVPLWNPYVFSGTPLLANYQSAALSPINLIYLFFPFVTAWSIQILLQPLFAGIFTYLFVRSLKIGQAASVLSAISFMFCGFITTWMMYGILGYAILFMPLALYAIQNLYETKKSIFFLILTLTIPLSLFSGHFQTSLYFLIVVGLFSIFKFLKEKNSKLGLINLLSILFGLLISMAQLIPSAELYFQSVRSALFFKTEVIPWEYFPTFLAPDFFGNPVTRNSWFGHYAEWNAYVGLIPLMLALYSLRKINSYICFFIIAAAISLLLAFNTPLLDLLVAIKIPVLSTSAASRIIVIFSFSLAVLAGFGFEYLLVDIKKRKIKQLFIWLSGFALIFSILWVIVFFQIFMPADKIRIAFSNLRLPSIIFALVVFIISVSLFIKNKKTIIIVTIFLLILTTVDSLRFVQKWQPFDPRSLVYPEVPVTKFLKNYSGFNRAFGAASQEFLTEVRIPGVEGYDPLYIGRYGELINSANDGNYHAPDRSVVQLSKNGKYTGDIINLLGVKYIIHSISDGREVWAFPFWKYPQDQFKTIFKDNHYEIFENNRSLPRAFIVYDYEADYNRTQILKKLLKKDFDFSKTVIIETDLGVELQKSTGSARIKNYTPNKITIEATSVNPGILVLTNPYYPGWKVKINDSEATIYRVDYALQATLIPSGQSNVEFIYDPKSFKIGIAFASLGIIGTLLTYLFLRYKSHVK